MFSLPSVEVACLAEGSRSQSINSGTFHGPGGSESTAAEPRLKQGGLSSPTTSKVGPSAWGLSCSCAPMGQGSGNSSGQVGRCLMEKWRKNTSVAASLTLMPGSAADVGKSLQNLVNDEWKGERQE